MQDVGSSLRHHIVRGRGKERIVFVDSGTGFEQPISEHRTWGRLAAHPCQLCARALHDAVAHELVQRCHGVQHLPLQRQGRPRPEPAAAAVVPVTPP